MYYYLIFLGLAIFIGCTTSGNNTDISDNSNMAYLKVSCLSDSMRVKSAAKNVIFEELTGQTDTVLTRGDEPIIQHKLETPGYTFTTISNRNLNFLLIPGDTLKLNISTDSIFVTGEDDIARINSFYLSNSYRKINEFNSILSNGFYAISSQERYKNLADSLLLETAGIIEKASAEYNLPDWFNDYEKSKMKYAGLHMLNTFGYSCGSTGIRKNAVLDQNALAYLDNYNFSDAGAIYCDMYYYFLFSYINLILNPPKEDQNNNSYKEYVALNFRCADSLLTGKPNRFYKTWFLSFTSRGSKYDREELKEFITDSGNAYFASGEFVYTRKRLGL